MSQKLLSAIYAGDEDECKRVLKFKNINIHQRDKSGWSAILKAFYYGRVNIIELLTCGANINDKDNNGRSSLILTSMDGHVDVVEMLLSKGSSIMDKDNLGYSSIMWASYKGHVKVAELLLSKDADVNDVSNTGTSSIRLASMTGHVNIVELLLSKGANFNDVLDDLDIITRSDKIKHILRKWPITMAILILKELGLYYQTDASTLIDLYQYIGRERLS